MSSMSQDAIRNDGVLPLVVECAESGILSKTLASSIEWLLREQAPEGFWVGMVETNSSIEAEWLLAAHILETELPLTRGLIAAQRGDATSSQVMLSAFHRIWSVRSV